MNWEDAGCGSGCSENLSSLPQHLQKMPCTPLPIFPNDQGLLGPQIFRDFMDSILMVAGVGVGGEEAALEAATQFPKAVYDG